MASTKVLMPSLFSVNLTPEEWETVVTLKDLEYLIVFRESTQPRKRISKSRHLVVPKSHELARRDKNISPKRKRITSSKTENHRCPNCLTTDSALWRNCIIKGKSHHLCNACGLRFKKGKFCPLCYKVYYDVDTNPQEWRQCNVCYNWTHRSCLQESGKDPNAPYTCSLCFGQEAE